jgi:hypothetical protein
MRAYNDFHRALCVRRGEEANGHVQGGKEDRWLPGPLVMIPPGLVRRSRYAMSVGTSALCSAQRGSLDPSWLLSPCCGGPPTRWSTAARRYLSAMPAKLEQVTRTASCLFVHVGPEDEAPQGGHHALSAGAVD